MSTAWRAAGITYIQYSNICARIVRQCLQANLRPDSKKEATSVRFIPWVNGKPVQKKTE